MNRALLCAALANGRSVITNVVYCDDTNYMIAALQTMGIRLRQYTNRVEIFGQGGKFKPVKKMYIGNAGTVKRFLTPFVGKDVLVGSKRMSQRPITDLEKVVDELRLQHTVRITGAVSSQFISALLMYAPTLGKTVSIQVTGKLVSAPYVQMTILVMKQFGVKVTRYNFRQRQTSLWLASFIIHPQNYHAIRYRLEADASSATYWWALAALTRSHITITNLSTNTVQPDARFQQLVKTIPKRVNMSAMPDSVMSLAVVAACQPTTTTITGIAHLASKETDRLQLLAKNLQAVGITAQAARDSLVIVGDPSHIHGGRIQTSNDHRMAMAFAVLGLRTGHITIDQPNCVSKSYPTFWQDLKAIQQHSRRQTIILTGMRGSGKTTWGRALAKQSGATFIDTDELITRQQQQSITQIVAKHGWPWFRKLEYQVLKKIHRKKNCIIATGGGALLDHTNYAMVKHHYVILLTAPIAELRRRLRYAPRPSLGADLNSLWRQRRTIYYRIAHSVYDSRNLS